MKSTVWIENECVGFLILVPKYTLMVKRLACPFSYHTAIWNRAYGWGMDPPTHNLPLGG
jgi:hypothetical protein